MNTRLPMSFRARKASGSRGQALLEFALIVTILLLLVGGIVDVSRMYFAYQVATESAHEGAVYGALHPGSRTAIRNRILKSSSAIENAANSGRIAVTMETSENKNCADGANVMVVTVTYTLPLHMPLTMAMFGNDIPISATEKALVLQPQCSP